MPPNRALAALGVLTLINLLNYLDRYVLSGMLPLVQAEFGRSDAEMGVLTASFLVVYSIAAPFTGLLGDRFPRRWFIGVGVLLWSAATIASGLSRTFPELLVARALIGVGEAGYAAVAPSYIADLFDARSRGRMLSLFYAALPVGSALGFTLGGMVGEAHGWRHAFWVAGAPGIALGLAALFLHEPRRGATDPPGATPLAAPPVREVLRALLATRSYLVNTAGFTVMTFAMGGLAAWMPTFLHRERGLSLSEAGLWFGGILVVAGFAGTLAGGWLGDRMQARDGGGYFVVSGVGLALAVPAGLVGVLAVSPAVYWPALFVALFFLFFNTGPLNAALVNVVPATMRATAVAVNVLVIHLLGDALSPALIGWVSDRASLSLGVVLTCLTIGVSAAILLAGAGSLRRDRATIEAGRWPEASRLAA